jgi:dihydrofolate reductase
MSCAVFIAASIDGFIARPDGGIDWLHPEDGMENQDYGYNGFIRDIDAIVMGRGSFEKVLTFDSWPYGSTRVVVLSTRPLTIPDRVSQTVEHLSGPPEEIVARLGGRGFTRLYIDGGKTIQGFLRAGLIDRMTITRIPVVLGEGIPLFGATGRDIRLEHVRTHAYPDGLVQTEYRVRREESAKS